MMKNKDDINIFLKFHRGTNSDPWLWSSGHLIVEVHDETSDKMMVFDLFLRIFSKILVIYTEDKTLK